MKAIYDFDFDFISKEQLSQYVDMIDEDRHIMDFNDNPELSIVDVIDDALLDLD